MIGSDTDSLPEGAVPETAEQIERHIVLYDACIRYVDSEIGRMLGVLESRGVRDHTIVGVSADHGEAFWEHDVGGHGRTLYDEEIRIPLVMSLPGRYDKPLRVVNQVRMVDLAAAVLDLADIDVPPGWEGISLIDRISGGVRRRGHRAFLAPSISLTETSMRKGVLPVKAMRTDGWKAIIQPATGLVEVYDLKNDPAETSNLWPRQPAPADSLLRVLETIPGTRVAGWRLAFTGQMESTLFSATVELPKGSRFAGLDMLAARGDFVARIDDSERTLVVRSSPRDLNLLIFNTEPDHVDVTLTIRDELGDAESVYVGRGEKRPTEKRFSLSRNIAFGLPEAFESAAEAQQPGGFIWWLPGERTQTQGERRDLSPEERQRLKSLGYIQ
jgi:hypothetical protein